MKKLLALILAAAMVFALVACGESKPTEPATDEPTAQEATEPAEPTYVIEYNCVQCRAV